MDSMERARAAVAIYKQHAGPGERYDARLWEHGETEISEWFGGVDWSPGDGTMPPRTPRYDGEHIDGRVYWMGGLRDTGRQTQPETITLPDRAGGAGTESHEQTEDVTLDAAEAAAITGVSVADMQEWAKAHALND